MQNQIMDQKQLRHFGFILGTLVMGIFGIFIPLLKHQAAPIWPWLVAFSLFFLAFTIPKALKVIYKPWMKLGEVLGWINTRIILGFIFFVVITPISVILKLFNYDPLNRSLGKDLPTYKINSENQSIQHMERPY